MVVLGLFVSPYQSQSLKNPPVAGLFNFLIKAVTNYKEVLLATATMPWNLIGKSRLSGKGTSEEFEIDSRRNGIKVCVKQVH